jgi:hypothetical protein
LQAQQTLDAAIRAFDGFDEPSARDRLLELRHGPKQLDQLGGAPAVVTVNAATDWDLLTLDERRGLIRATVERATVVRGGRGADRITLSPFLSQNGKSTTPLSDETPTNGTPPNRMHRRNELVFPTRGGEPTHTDVELLVVFQAVLGSKQSRHEEKTHTEWALRIGPSASAGAGRA